MSTANPIRLGIIGSSKGSALAAANQCLLSAGFLIEWVIITDRECGLEVWANENGYSTYRLEYKDAESFSHSAYEIFQLEKCQNVILFYTRRIAGPLIDKGYVCNIHPSLLPSFRGMHAVNDALVAGVKIFGATLHQVDEGLDTGSIVAQVASPVPSGLLEAQINHISYWQKVWLILVWFDNIYCGSCRDIATQTFFSTTLGVCSPGLASKPLLNSYQNWLLSDEFLSNPK